NGQGVTSADRHVHVEFFNVEVTGNRAVSLGALVVDDGTGADHPRAFRAWSDAHGLQNERPAGRTGDQTNLADHSVTRGFLLAGIALRFPQQPTAHLGVIGRAKLGRRELMGESGPENLLARSARGEDGE